MVAGFAASAAVATSLAGPELESVTTPGAPVSRPFEPDVQAPDATFASSRRTRPAATPSPARTPHLVSRVGEIAPVSARSVAFDPPKGVDLPKNGDLPKTGQPPIDPPKYVPDPIAVAQTPAPAVNPESELAELTVERHSVIGIRLDYAVSSRTTRVEDRISATVSRDVTVEGRVAIPEGARLEGTITGVDRGGKFRERPRLSLQFDTMILTDGTRMSIKTDAIVREGDSPSADAAAKVGTGTGAGAILGSVLGGKKGAVIVGVTGAAAGTATVMSGDGHETALKSGAPLTVRLTDEIVVLVRKQ